MNCRWITFKYCLRIFLLSFLLFLCLFQWKTLYHSAMKALSSLAHIRRRGRKKSGVPFSKQNNDTSSRSLACVHSTDLHKNLSKVKGGRAKKKDSSWDRKDKRQKSGEIGAERWGGDRCAKRDLLSLWGHGEVAWMVGGWQMSTNLFCVWMPITQEVLQHVSMYVWLFNGN